MKLYLCLFLVLLSISTCSLAPVLQPPSKPSPTSLPTFTPPSQPTSTLPPATAAAIITLPPPATPAPTLTPTLTPPPRVSLLAVGDLMLARSVGSKVLSDGPQRIFADVATALGAADVLVGNLECALSAQGAPAAKGYTFAAPPEAVRALSAAGFDVVSQANNHALDYGPEALAETRRLLEVEGIAVVGAGPNEGIAHQPVIIEKNGLRLAFLAYVNVPVEGNGFDTRQWTAVGDQPGVAWAAPDRIRAEVSLARTQADLVIVLLHAGWEGQSAPAPEQQAAARAAIEGGAVLVIGAHPHLLQKTESYPGGLIVYSLGNFVFDGFEAPATYTAIFAATLTREGVAGVQWIPVVVESGLPRLATPEEASIILPLVGSR